MSAVKIPIVTLLVVSFAGFSHQIDRIKFEKDSFLSLSVDQIAKSFPNSGGVQKSWKVQISFKAVANDGVIFEYRSRDHTSWLTVGVLKSSIFLHVGKKGISVIEVQLKEGMLEAASDRVVLVEVENCVIVASLDYKSPIKLNLSSNYCDISKFSNDFLMNFGNSPSSVGQNPYVSSFTMCLHRAVINGHVLLLPDVAKESHNILPCPRSQPTDCDRNYCSENGICQKTVHCNDLIQVEEVKVAAAGIEHKTSRTNNIAINNTVEWIQLKFNQQYYTHGLSLMCSKSRVTHKILFYLQFSLEETRYYNYTTDGQTKIFQSDLLYQTHYLSWPVKTKAIRIRFPDPIKIKCNIDVEIFGCSKRNFVETNMLRYDEKAPTLIAQSPLSKLETIMTSYGIVNEGIYLPDLSASDLLTYKSKVFDQMSYGRELHFKVEFGSDNDVIDSWVTSAPCDDATTKFDILDDVQSLVNFYRNKDSLAPRADLKCSWERNSSSGILYKKDFLVRIFAHKPFQAIDRFRFLRQVQISHGNTEVAESNAVEESALACLSSSDSCLGFEVIEKRGGTTLTYRLTNGEEKMSYNENASIYLVREILQRKNTTLGARASDVIFTGWPNLGYQCQCVNQRIGSRCNHTIGNSNARSVTVTEYTRNTYLNCTNTGENHVIRIEFANGGAAKEDVADYNVEAKSDFNSVRITELVRFLCNGRTNCNLSVSIIDSMLPSSGLNYLEIRYLCEEISDIFSRTITSHVIRTSTNGEGSGLCEGCSFESSLERLVNKINDQGVEANATKEISFPTTPSIYSTANYINTKRSDISTLSNTQTTNYEADTTLARESTQQLLTTTFQSTTQQFVDADCSMNQHCISNKTSVLMDSINMALNDPNSSISINELAQNQASLLETSQDNLRATDLTRNVEIISQIVTLQHSSASNKNENEIFNSTIDLTSSILSSVDLLFDDRMKNVWSNISEVNRSSIANDLTASINEIGFALADTLANEQSTKYLENTAFQVVNIKYNTVNTSDHLSFPNNLSDENNSTLEQNNWTKHAGSIMVPVDRTEGLESSYVFAVYKNLDTLLGNSFENELNSNNGNFADLKTNQYAVNSYVISASIKSYSSDFIKEKKVRITLKHKSNSKNNTRCVYWQSNSQANPHGGYWSSAGCRTLRTNESHTVCECDHLTNFAILMDVVGVEISEYDEYLLTLITWIGCSSSIVFLLLSLFCFHTLTGLRSTRNSIHKNLCMNLMLAQTLFLLGSDYVDYPILCPIIAGTLHYLFLAVFAWMCVEGWHLYVSLVKVFEVDKASRLVSYYVFAYSVPALVVIISAAVDYGGYGTEKSCWLSTNSHLIWAFVGPALCVITVNLYFFFIALRVMRAHRITTPHYRSRMDKTRTWIKGSAVLLCLLGIPWVFGVFYVNEKTLLMAYIFTACNSLQGVFIFIFHCILNERVRCEMSKYMRRSRWLFSTRSYHLSSTTRSAYTTSASMNFRSRHSSGESLGNATSISPRFTDEKYTKKIAERQLTPVWNKSQSTQVDSNRSFVKPSTTKPVRRTIALPPQLIIANINARELEKRERDAREIEKDGIEEGGNQSKEIGKPKDGQDRIILTTDIQSEQKEKIKQITIEINERHKNKELPSLDSLAPPSGCNEESEIQTDRKCKTPIEQRKLRIERFYLDYNYHFGETTETGHDVIFRNRSLPLNVNRVPTTSDRVPTTSDRGLADGAVSSSMHVIKSI